MLHEVLFHCLGSCMTSTSMTGDVFARQSMLPSSIPSHFWTAVLKALRSTANISLNRPDEKSGSKVRKIVDYRELWYQNRINSQIWKKTRKAWTKIFLPIHSQSKQIFIFSFVTILSAYGFFCRLPLWSSLCVFKDNKHTFWPSVGWAEM